MSSITYRSVLWAVAALAVCTGTVWHCSATRAQASADVFRAIKQLDAQQKAGEQEAALRTARRVVELAQKVFRDDEASLATTLGIAANALAKLEKPEEALALYQREIALSSGRTNAGRDHLGHLNYNLAAYLRQLNRYQEAEQPARQALAVFEQVYGKNADAVGGACNLLAMILDQLRKDDEAERVAKRSADIWEAVHGPESREYGNALHTLVGVLRTRGRWADAEKPARKVVEIWSRSRPRDEGAVANAENTLADVLMKLGKYSEAETLARDVVRVWGPICKPGNCPAVNARNTLAAALDGVGKRDEAIRESEAVLALFEKLDGKDSGSVGLGANNLAWKLLGLGKLDRAEQLFRRTLAIWSNSDRRPFKPATAIPLSGLGQVAFAKGDWATAYDWLKRAVDISIARTRLRPPSLAADRRAPSEAAQAAGNLTLLIKAAFRLAAAQPEHADELRHATFTYAQWRSESHAADALADMASRLQQGPALAALVRDLQDATGQWADTDKALDNLRADPAGHRVLTAEARLRQRAAELEQRIHGLSARIARENGSYAAVASAAVVSVSDLQPLIGPEEAVVLILECEPNGRTPREAFVWVVTRTGIKWLSADFSDESLADTVAALRCGLDDTSWRGEGGGRCSRLLGVPRPKDDETLPFDAARAWRLYERLLAPAVDLLHGKELIIVPTGALTRLPMQVLVSEDPGTAQPADPAKLAWLARSYATSVMPAIASLAALRRQARASSASRKLLVGFGNPLLDGLQHDARYGARDREQAALARERNACGTFSPVRTAMLGTAATTRSRRSARPSRAEVPLVGDLANLAMLRAQPPLPETADELCAVARDLGADPADIHIGSGATETEVKRLSSSGALARYRMVEFATHGALAGELRGTKEPGLVLTPPARATSEDDGYLSASEIAALRLDADLVILSACNTAGGEGRGAAAEALSGIARAFFYAQARALLVTHWAVDSETTVKLITGFAGELARHPRIGRAEALRRAMQTLIVGGDADPADWAPFIVVGDAGVAR